MKPDWKDAPEWANWLAMDDGGEWWWYELKPAYKKQFSFWMETCGKTEVALPCISGDESLEARP